MTTEYLIIVAVLLVLLAEVTYLVTKLPRTTTTKKRMIFVDTSVLIDGRIIAVAESGFIGDTLAIPRSVVGELQFLADNADHEKRSRARHGLDVVKELQEMPQLDVMIFPDGSKAEEGVDNRLLTLAKKHRGVICTIDFNLNKVAVVEGLTVLNVNQLAQNLRMAYLPGEKIQLELVQKGQDSHQGVGYLPDGTMVVVEHASKNIGQTVDIEFIRSLQTAAGKMMFARKLEQAKKPQARKPVLQAVAAEPVLEKIQKPEPRPKKQRPAGRAPQMQPQARPQAQSQPEVKAPRAQEAPARRRQAPGRKSSQSREDALIDLVEKQ